MILIKIRTKSALTQPGTLERLEFESYLCLFLQKESCYAAKLNKYGKLKLRLVTVQL